MAGGSCAKPGYFTSPYSDTLGQLALSQYMAGASLQAVRSKAVLLGCSPGWLSWQVRPAVPARGHTTVTPTCFCPDCAAEGADAIVPTVSAAPPGRAAGSKHELFYLMII